MAKMMNSSDNFLYDGLDYSKRYYCLMQKLKTRFQVRNCFSKITQNPKYVYRILGEHSKNKLWQTATKDSLLRSFNLKFDRGLTQSMSTTHNNATFCYPA